MELVSFGSRSIVRRRRHVNIVQLYIVLNTHCCKINIKQVLHVYHKLYNLIRLVENNVGQKQP